MMWTADPLNENPREACGVFGIWAPGLDVARLTFFGLHALQHRGQESAGIATSDGRAAYTQRGLGLVAQVFHEENLRALRGHMAIGHTRYATSGSTQVRNAQPHLVETLDGPLGVAHNGNLIDGLSLRDHVLRRGVGLSSSSDTEVIAQLLAAPHDEERSDEADWVGRILRLMQASQGAYSLAILTRRAIYGVRDPWGFRPLCLGELIRGGESRGWVLASESCALEPIGARLVREIRPGECVRIDDDGVTSFMTPSPAPSRALCSFEYVYFARPDSVIGGTVHQVRQRLGWELAHEAPVEADVVIGVPDSATPSAIGYALGSGIPYNEGFTKNRYIGRTFIQPNEELRANLIRLKYTPLRANLEGKRVVVLDDSIVRGSTSGPLIAMLRDAGAREVHMRVSSPPVRHPCFMGVDMPTHAELIAHRLDTETIGEHIGADSIAYLSHEGMMRAIRETTGDEDGFCTACFGGEYPVPVDEALIQAQSQEPLIEKIRERMPTAPNNETN